MVGLCFFFEPYDVDVWSGREIDLDAWNYAAKAAGDVDRCIVVNRTSARLRPFDADVQTLVVSELPALSGVVAHVCTAAEAQGAKRRVDLWEEPIHKEVDWYVFGPADGWRHSVDLALVIPTASDLPFHSVHAASIVLAHRYGMLRSP